MLLQATTRPRPSRSNLPVYEGAAFRPVEGRIDTYPEVAEAVFDDYIFVFPADSGIPPLYAVFATPRDYPVVASGKGQLVSSRWLVASSRGKGAAIPMQIAQQLRGKEFRNFRHLGRRFGS
ncbi:hypothetical protein G7009_10380 [Pseudomonas capeferrum]|nr:hypothetical protein [Pseudomonas capeferrum]